MDAEAPLMTYTLEVFGPADDPEWVFSLPALGYSPAHIQRYITETEENLTDLLPEGYSVRIKEWDDEHD